MGKHIMERTSLTGVILLMDMRDDLEMPAVRQTVRSHTFYDARSCGWQNSESRQRRNLYAKSEIYGVSTHHEQRSLAPAHRRKHPSKCMNEVENDAIRQRQDPVHQSSLGNDHQTSPCIAVPRSILVAVVPRTQQTRIICSLLLLLPPLILACVCSQRGISNHRSHATSSEPTSYLSVASPPHLSPTLPFRPPTYAKMSSAAARQKSAPAALNPHTITTTWQ